MSMLTFEKFTSKYPRFKLRAHLAKHKVETVEQAMSHFKGLNVQIERELLETVFGVAVPTSESDASTDSQNNVEPATASQEEVIEVAESESPMPRKPRTVRKRKAVEKL